MPGTKRDRKEVRVFQYEAKAYRCPGQPPQIAGRLPKYRPLLEGDGPILPHGLDRRSGLGERVPDRARVPTDEACDLIADDVWTLLQRISGNGPSGLVWTSTRMLPAALVA